MRINFRYLLLLTGLACLTNAHAVQATTNVPVPAVPLTASTSSAPLLSISSPAGSVKLSLADLDGLGMHQVTTRTFWPEDDGRYAGPLLAKVLERAGLAKAAYIRVRARDGFSQVIPRQDWERWPVILATQRDGKPMTARNKGPLRIIYPRDMAKELEDSVYRLRWVWLLVSIEAVEAP